MPQRSTRRSTASASAKACSCVSPFVLPAQYLVAAEAIRRDLLFRDARLPELLDHRLGHRRRTGDEIAEAVQVPLEVVAEQVRIDVARLAVPRLVVRHREHEADVRVPLLELLQFVEERGRLAIAVRVDERDAMRQPLLGDVEEHRAKDGDADAARDERERPFRLAREEEVALRLLDVDLGADGKLRERTLERRVAHARAEAEDAALVRRRDDRDVPARAFLVVVRRVEERDPEVLPGGEVDLLAEQIEGDQQGPLRNLALLLDLRPHRSELRTTALGRAWIAAIP